jgi:glycosyltransferase involved in cell wall biosynthesis
MARKDSRLNIVCISPAPWDYPVWTNRQHIMSGLSQHHRVLYVFHPVFLRSSIKRNITLSKSKPVSMLNKINDNLTTFTPFILPFSDKTPGLHQMNIRLSSSYMNKFLGQLGFKEFILWFYDPEAVAYLDYLQPILSCYDCVDEYSTMPYYSSHRRKQRLEHLEKQLIERCDIVFTTSENLYNQKKQLNPNTYLVENVGDFEHFNKVDYSKLKVPQDFPSVSSPVIGFIGAMDHYKVDFDLIEFIADMRPQWNLIMIGSRMNSKEKRASYPKKSNIYYLGGKEYRNLPDYAANFDICIIPYKINEYTKNVFPIKFFEFLATGKPVVTTALPALLQYGSIVNISQTYEEFLDAIEQSLYHDSGDLKKERLQIAKKHTWESRKERLLFHIQKALKDNLNT